MGGKTALAECRPTRRRPVPLIGRSCPFFGTAPNAAADQPSLSIRSLSHGKGPHATFLRRPTLGPAGLPHPPGDRTSETPCLEVALECECPCRQGRRELRNQPARHGTFSGPPSQSPNAGHTSQGHMRRRGWHSRPSLDFRQVKHVDIKMSLEASARCVALIMVLMPPRPHVVSVRLHKNARGCLGGYPCLRVSLFPLSLRHSDYRALCWPDLELVRVQRHGTKGADAANQPSCRSWHTLTTKLGAKLQQNWLRTNTVKMEQLKISNI